MTAAQSERLQQVYRNFRSDSERVMAEWRELPREEQTAARLQQDLAALQSQLEPALRTILTPEQLKRSLQVQFQRSLAASALLPLLWPEVTAELELTAEQRDQLAQTVSDARGVLFAEQQRLAALLEEDLRSVLTAEQRTRLDKLLGQPAAVDDGVWIAVRRPEETRRGSSLLLAVLAHPAFAGELGLHDDQMQPIRDLVTDYRLKENDLFRSRGVPRANPAPGIGGQPVIAQALRRLRADTDLQIQQILRPNQFHRLQQLVWQARVQAESPPVPLLSQALATELQLTDQQRLRLQERNAQEQTEGAAQRRQFYHEVLGGVIRTFTPEQQSRYAALVGEPFPGIGAEWGPHRE